MQRLELRTVRAASCHTMPSRPTWSFVPLGMPATEQFTRRQLRGSLVTPLLVPPLAPIIWILMSGSDRPAYLRSRLVRAGIAVLALSALSLLYVIEMA